jgi:hypothetical protein
VTNVLTNPALAGLLSDEGASEASSNGVIVLPRYTIAALAPAMITHPRGKTALPGTTVQLTAMAVGDPPLSTSWLRNGIPIPGSTNSILVLSNLQSANAGSYSFAASNSAGSLTSRAGVVRINTSVYAALFADDFETNSSANWSVFWGASNGIPDYSVDWAYDHSATPYTFNGLTSLIPPAPNSPDGSAHGVRLSVNNNDTNGSIAAVNLYPKAMTFSGNYALKFDLWINYPGGAAGINATGSTEHAVFGINHLGTQVNWAAPSASSSDGLWFAVDGEGGTSRDYRAYQGNLSGTQIELIGQTASGLQESNNAAAIYQSLFPSSQFETAGAPGKNWIEVELRQTNGAILWLANGVIIAQRSNASSFTSGDVMLGYMDLFSSIANPASDAFTLIDNVRVEDLSGQALQPPSIFMQPPDQTVIAGSNALFTAGASGSPPLSFQWRFNGTNLSGATQSALPLVNVQSASAGDYDVIVTNLAGMTASAIAVLSVRRPDVQLLAPALQPNGQARMVVSAPQGEIFTIDASTNLKNWVSLASITITNGPVPFVDAAATNFVRRFYRARAGAP